MNIKEYQKEFQREMFSIVNKTFTRKDEKRKALLIIPLIAKKFKEILEKIILKIKLEKY